MFPKYCWTKCPETWYFDHYKINSCVIFCFKDRFCIVHLKKYLLSICYLPGSREFWSLGIYNLVEETEKKQEEFNLINMNFRHKDNAAAKSLQSCLTLCKPIDGSPPGSAVPGIFQARALEWVAIAFSSAWKWKVTVKSLSHVRLFVTPWTVAYQAFPSMGFSRLEYWSGMPSPSPAVLNN